MSETRSPYQEALKDRRIGVASHLGADATFLEARGDFYADARILSEDALEVFNQLPQLYPPYGLLDRNGGPIHSLEPGRHAWRVLVGALGATGWEVFNRASLSIDSCPYHQALSNLGGSRRPLDPISSGETGIDRLRDVVVPGAVLNAVVFTSLIERMPGLQKLHGDTTDTEIFARNSVALLREPLGHPQEWAEAFVYTLGTLTDLITGRTLPDELARIYTKVEETSAGTRLNWAIPTEEFTTHSEVRVANRLEGPETDKLGEHNVVYPAGTKLNDIVVHEPVIGCPGDKLARAMWDRVVDVAVGEKLWAA